MTKAGHAMAPSLPEVCMMHQTNPHNQDPVRTLQKRCVKGVECPGGKQENNYNFNFQNPHWEPLASSGQSLFFPAAFCHLSFLCLRSCIARTEVYRSSSAKEPFGYLLSPRTSAWHYFRTFSSTRKLWLKRTHRYLHGTRTFPSYVPTEQGT